LALHRFWLLQWRLSLLLHHPRFRCHSSHLTWAWCLRWPQCHRCPSPRHPRPRCPRRLSPSHTWLRRLHPRHAWPRHHLHATPSLCGCSSAVRCPHRCHLLWLLHPWCL
jgi:hypothetical protein